MAHNGAGFDNHYLFHYLIKDNGLTVDPIYSGSKLLQFTVKKSTKDKDYLIRGTDSAQFFSGAIEIITETIWFRHIGFQKGIFPLQVRQARSVELCGQVSKHFLLCPQ